MNTRRPVSGWTLHARLAGLWLVIAAGLYGRPASFGQGVPPAIWNSGGHAYTVTDLDLSPDGTLLVSSSGDKTVKIWRYADGQVLRTLVIPYDIDEQVTNVAAARFTADGLGVLVAMDHYNAHNQARFGKVRLFRLSDGAVIRVFDGHLEGISAIALSPDGELMASAGLDSRVKIWRVADGTLLQTLDDRFAPVNDVRFSAQGDRLCGGYDGGFVLLWRTADWSLEREVAAHSQDVTRVAFSPDDSRFASASWDGTARVFRISDGAELRTLPIGSGVYTVAFSPDGTTLATGGFDRTIRLWDPQSGELQRTFPAQSGYIYDLLYSPDGTTLHSAGGYREYAIKLWNPADGTVRRELTQHLSYLAETSFSSDNRFVATASSLEEVVRVFNAATGQLVHRWNTGTDGLDVEFSPDNQLVAMPGGNRTVTVRRLSDGNIVQSLTGHAEEVTSVAFSPDGTLLASGSTFPGTIRLYRTSDWTFVREIKDPTSFGAFLSMCFSPDGTLLGAAGEAAPLVFRVSDGTRVKGPTGITSAVAFSPDGQLFVVSGGVYQDEVRIFRTSDWARIRDLPVGADDVAFTSDGAYLFAAHLDAIRIWRTADWSLVETYDRELGYVGSGQGVKSIAVSPDGVRFAFGRNDAMLVLCRNPVGIVKGDLNCDGRVDFGDINPFVLALSDPDEYRRQFPDCNLLNGDVNEDGRVDFGDINPFVELLSGK